MWTPAALSGHPWLGISSIKLRNVLCHPWPKRFLRFIELINLAHKVSGVFMQEIQWTLRKNVSARRQKRGRSSWSLLFHQPQSWSCEVSYLCASVCGLLLILHMSLQIWCKLSPWDQRFHVVQKSNRSSTTDLSSC